MESEVKPRRFLAQSPITRDGKTFVAKAYPPPPDSRGPLRYIVEDPLGNQVQLKLEEQMGFDRLIFGKPEPEDVFQLESKK